MKPLLLLLVLTTATYAQDPSPTPSAASSPTAAASDATPPPKPKHSPRPTPTPTPGPLAPATLPGKGLAQHDFFFAGEAHTQDMYIVRGGKIVWEYHSPDKNPEISDAVLLSNSNVLYAHMDGVTMISPDKKVIWNYDSPKGTQIHTAVPIGTDRVLFIANSATPTVNVVNIVTGSNELQFPIQCGHPANVHPQFRHARLTPAGTLLVAHMDMNTIREYDTKGNILWSPKTLPKGGPWSAIRLPSGNTLCSNGAAHIYELNPAGDIVWDFTQADAPDFKFWLTQTVTRLPNGNTIFNNWFNQWDGKIDPANLPIQALEVTPGKKVVWALQSWLPPAALGPATTIQILDDPTVKPEAVHFGNIH